jgi:hypothetical protein
MVAQLPEAQVLSLTLGRECPSLEELPTLIFERTLLISGESQDGQTGATRSSLWMASSSKVLWQWSQQNSYIGIRNTPWLLMVTIFSTGGKTFQSSFRNKLN